jgi:hypothetical protein
MGRESWTGSGRNLNNDFQAFHEGFRGKKTGTFQPFLLFSEGRMIPNDNNELFFHYGKDLAFPKKEQYL